MEEIIQLFRRLKKSKSVAGLDLDLASPTAASNSGGLAVSNDLQKAKFKLKKPRLTSPTEKRILQSRKQQKRPSPLASEAAVASSCELSEATSEAAIAKCRAGSPFADEDDLYADRDEGVYMQSSSSSSPATSERHDGPKLPKNSSFLTYKNFKFCQF